ncbi:MAG: alpha/beta hydrolase [Gammaproteobacteria bacterium]|nr:MAG: alpha/beta hydrolase [Gammaproteobacteria bacterium]
MPYFSTGEVELYYEMLGSGEESIVFLNGVMMNTDTWAIQTRELKDKYNIVVSDFRGQGKSSKPDMPYTFEMHADDLKQLLDGLGIKKAHFVGTSYGAEVGMHFALRYPALVKSLVLATAVSESDALLKHKIETWKVAAKHALELGEQSKYDFFLSCAPLNFSSMFIEKHPDFIHERATSIAKFSDEWFTAFIRLCECFQSLDITGQLHKINVPSLIIAAEYDDLKTVRYSSILSNEIPNSESVIVMNAGHSMVIENSREFLTCILGFISKIK